MSLIFESSPLPYGLLVLWLALPGIWLAAGTLTQALTADRAVRRILQPAAALAAWIVVVQLASMIARSFWIGLPAGMILLSAAGLASWFWRRRTFVVDTSTAKDEPGFSRGMWLSMLLVTAPIAVISLHGHFHDELLNNGHMSFVAQLQNDYFPPRYLGFTHIPLRYHYGFDLVCAGLTALTRLKTDVAIHLATIVGWAYCWCLLWVLGERMTGSRRGGLLTALATLVGGGVVVLFAPLALHYHVAGASTPLRSLLGMYSVGDGMRLRTIVVDYFFQHPFSLGFPLAAATLLVAASATENRGCLARYVLLGLLLTSLSLTQDIVCITLGTTLAFTEIVVARRWRFAFVLLGAAIAAWACGGLLFTRIPDAPPMGLYPRFWLLEHSGLRWPMQVLLWHALTFLPLLPLSLLGARWVARPMRWPLLLWAGGSLAVPIFVGYVYSADILKFSAVALFAMGILAGAGLNYLADRKGWQWRTLFGACLIATLMSAVVTMAGILWAQFRHVEALATYYEGPVALGADDRHAVDWLRRRVLPDEIVYCTPDIATGYAQLGGLPSTPIFGNISQFGVPERRARQQKSLLENLPADLDSYRAVGISWFVVGPDDPRMESNTRRWVAAGQLVEQAQFGSLKIYRLADSGSPPK